MKTFTSAMERIELNMQGVTDPKDLSRLRVERNSWTPILRLLPEDVFIAIFFLLQITFDELDDKSIKTLLTDDPEQMLDNAVAECYGFWDWTTVTHVCHYWRQTALNHSKLWAKIKSGLHTNQDWTKTYLMRSKMQDLSIRHFVSHRSSADPKAHSACLRMILEELPRIRELHLSVRKEHDLQLLQKSLMRPAPKLDRFHIAWFSDGTDDLLEHMQFIHSLFGNSAPQLQHLVMHVTYFDWKSPLLKNLKTLRVWNEIGDIPVSLPDLFAVIDACHELEELSIQYHEIKDISESSLIPLNLTKLQNLELMWLKNEVWERILQHITLPDELLSWSVGIDGLPSPDEDSIPPTLINRNNACQHLLLFFTPQAVEIREDDIEEDGFRRCASVQLMWESFSTAEGAFGLTANLIESKSWCHASTLEIRLSKSIDWLSEIYPEEMRINDKCWYKMLKVMPNLEFLDVSFDVGPLEEISPIEEALFLYVLIALAKALTRRNGKDKGYICPRLSKLKIKSFLFRNRKEINVIPELKECLKARKKAGIPIHDLEIVDGHAARDKVFKALMKHGFVVEDQEDN